MSLDRSSFPVEGIIGWASQLSSSWDVLGRHSADELSEDGLLWSELLLRHAQTEPVERHGRGQGKQ